MSRRARIAIVGGGPAGSLLAILLARRGLEPLVIERSPSFEPSAQGGRSINLALAARGIDALRRAGVDGDVAELMIPMRGRMLHDPRGTQRFLRYGQRTHEEIYSVSRAALNALLYRLAAERHGVEYRFGHRCVGVDLGTGAPLVESASGRRARDADVVLACDGAGSEVRRALAEGGAIEAAEELLDHGYKELTIPPARADDRNGGDFALDPKALHIWPRGGFMLIALPNPDKSFTATLFLPHKGPGSFASITQTGAQHFFAQEFPDALALMPNLDAEFASHPTGILGTVHCEPWSYRGRLLLVGDAAHAIVPFHGQGMNAAFEDCIALDGLIDEHGGASACDWPTVLERFEESREPNTRAIAEMAVENYLEMRDLVRDPKFQLRAQLSFELERRFPGKFIPRYSMVMFHPEISYAEAQRRGNVQLEILRELTANANALTAVDFARAAALIGERL
jgi:kynurenine 3-monooxygenase